MPIFNVLCRNLTEYAINIETTLAWWFQYVIYYSGFCGIFGW